MVTLSDMKVKPGSMGKPIPGNKVDIIDDKGNPVPVGQVGMSAVHRTVTASFKEYLNGAVRTAKAFHGEWYLTGDLAKRDEDGVIFGLKVVRIIILLAQDITLAQLK